MSDESEMFDGVEKYEKDNFSQRLLYVGGENDSIGKDDINRLSLRITRDPDLLHESVDTKKFKELKKARRLLRPSKDEMVFLFSQGYKIARLDEQCYAYNPKTHDLKVFNGIYFERTSMIPDPDGDPVSFHLAIIDHDVGNDYGLHGRCKVVGHIDAELLERRIESRSAVNNFKLADEFWDLDDVLSGSGGRLMNGTYGSFLRHPVRRLNLKLKKHH